MSDLDPSTILFAVAIGLFLVYNVAKPTFERLRKRTLQRRGVDAEAVVASVGPLAPPQRTEHPFTLRFRSPSGAEHVSELSGGFGGIVPVVGWRVPIRFDPHNPSNVEIAHNPYLHPLPGAPEPKKSSAVDTYVHNFLFVATIASMLTVLLFYEALGDAGPVAFGAIFVFSGLLALLRGIWSGVESSTLRRSSGRAFATVTHSWEEPSQRRSRNRSHITTSAMTTWVNAFTVLFDLPDGRQVHRRAPVASSATRYEPGQRLEVLYDQSDPTVIAVGSWQSSTVAPVAGIGLGTLFILVGLVIALFFPA
ncbi:hypothetical protein HNR23_000696 [Nocardiopsis mwathae]|uniref:DUF3592 domain-containing protein n=1 Tax=Nocardiopsis mwathae TaxID=1472723 RepID=A0A7W9YG34_9ACTN|nr:hypothetical protein [Nocardiopsis mwathae]